MTDRPITNAFTVDFEDWYHGAGVPIDQWSRCRPRIEEYTDYLLDLLDRHDARATFFVLGDNAVKSPRVVKALSDAGHRVGSHGFTHRFVYRQSPAEFEEELRRSMEVIQEITGRRVVSFRAPYFSITRKSLWALEILVRAGIRYDSSIFPAPNYRYGIPDSDPRPHIIRTPSGELFEFPLSMVEFLGRRLPVCGGAYFRILPYAVTRNGIGRLNRDRVPAVFYIHPWEIDENHPKVKVEFPISITHRLNMGKVRSRLERLLTDFRFAPLEEVSETYLRARREEPAR